MKALFYSLKCMHKSGLFVLKRNAKKLVQLKIDFKHHNLLVAVLCYLTMFRVKELGILHYRKFVDCFDTRKAYKVWPVKLHVTFK